MNAGGADWTMRDLSSQKAEWVNPISTNYKGYQVYEMPPQTQGFATLEMLNIVQQCGSQLGYDLHALGPRSPEFWSILSRPNGSPTLTCCATTATRGSCTSRSSG